MIKVITLVENTSISPDYLHKHGLSLYIETSNHKILFDLGSNGLFLENAKKLGVNIAEIDTVIISHGHADHGGALKLFLEINNTAKVYVRKNAFDSHKIKVLGLLFSVGLDSSLKKHPQIVLTDARTVIDDELMLFSDIDTHKFPTKANKKLYAQIDGRMQNDDFTHEQNLIITDGDKKTLFAGCAHAGIVNIKDKAEQIINGKLTSIVAGFHLYNPASRKRESDVLINGIADRLNDGETMYYTCHCTGKKVYEMMKIKLTDRIQYISVGTKLEL